MANPMHTCVDQLRVSAEARLTAGVDSCDCTQVYKAVLREACGDFSVVTGESKSRVVAVC